MDKKHAGNAKAKAFFKKNIYYIIMAICLLAIAAMITVTVLTQQQMNKGEPIDTPVDSTPIDNTPVENPSDGNNTPVDTTPVDTTPVDTTPVVTPIVFASPVQQQTIIMDYCMDSVVWHSTLKHYAVHNGIDFGGNDGDAVMSAYSGIVKDITYDILNGYTVTIEHNSTLTTTYSSLNEPSVSIGQVVSKGQPIGTMGVTGTSEYLSGAHVHFCLYENGKIANPNSYLASGNK